jgi:hypothetical protein
MMVDFDSNFLNLAPDYLALTLSRLSPLYLSVRVKPERFREVIIDASPESFVFTL